MGFIFGQGTYLKSASNVYEFVVAIFGVSEIILPASNNSDLSLQNIISMFRIFKIFRTFKGMPKLKLIIKALVRSFTSLDKVITLLLMILTTYGGVLLQIFKGRLEYRCRYTAEPLPGTRSWPVVIGAEYLCGYKACPQGTFCRSTADYGLPFEYTSAHRSLESVNSEQFNFGLANFDDLISSIMTLFQVILGEGWSQILFIVRQWLTDSTGTL